MSNGPAALVEGIRLARRKFLAMAATYAMGVFNDNFFKQAAMLLALDAGRVSLQGWATTIFTLPFLLFAAPAGWLADRHRKRQVIVGAKLLELAAMAVGALGLLWMNWPMLFCMLFLMASQSALFSPALNGSIPELYPPAFVTTANARLRVVSTGAILGGIAAAGFFLDGAGPSAALSGRESVAATVVVVAFLGFLVSLGVPSFPAAAPEAPFPRSGPLETLSCFWAQRQDRLLFLCLLGESFFWFVASLQVQLINLLGSQELGLGKAETSGLVVAQLVGVAMGGLLSARLARGKDWHRLLAPALLVMALGMAGLGLVPLLFPALALGLALCLLALMGLAGGIFVVPVESFIQVRPEAAAKGRIWSVANFGAFGGVLLSGPVFVAMHGGGLPPSMAFVLTGFLTALTAWGLRDRLRSVAP